MKCGVMPVQLWARVVLGATLARWRQQPAHLRALLTTWWRMRAAVISSDAIFLPVVGGSLPHSPIRVGLPAPWPWFGLPWLD